MRSIILLSLCCILTCCTPCCGQDALKEKASHTSDEQELMILSSKLAALLRYTDTSLAGQYANEAIALSHRTKDDTKHAEVWQHLFLYYRKLRPLQTLSACDSIMYYAEQSRDALTLGMAYYYKGISDNTQEANQYFFKAMNYFQKVNAHKEFAWACYQVSGGFSYTPALENEERYARLGLYHAQKSGQPDALCLAYLAMSSYYQNYYEKREAKFAYIDSCVLMLQKCLTVYKTNEQNCEMRFIPGTAALNLANWYYRYYPQQKDTAWKWIVYAQDCARKMGDYTVLGNSYGLQSTHLLEEKDTTGAEQILLKALSEVPSVNHNQAQATMYYFLVSLYGDLARFAEWRKDYKQSLFYTRQQLANKDSMLNARTVTRLNNMEYEYNRKKMEDENAYNKRVFYYALALATLGLVTLTALIALYRSRLAKSVQDKKILEITAQKNLDEKNKALLLASLEKEKAERLAIEQLLTQQKNELLQKEALASSMQLIQKDELLQRVQDRLQQETPVMMQSDVFKEISRSIETHRMLNEDITYYKEKINQVHPDFFEQLQLKSNNQLTPIDFKYCVYIYLGISTKNMASIMQVELSSVRMAKYRIKQKLQLPKEEDLGMFITRLV